MKLLTWLRGGGLTAGERQTLKWTLMVFAIFWTLVFQLGEDRQGLPEFIYVNF